MLSDKRIEEIKLHYQTHPAVQDLLADRAELLAEIGQWRSCSESANNNLRKLVEKAEDIASRC